MKLPQPVYFLPRETGSGPRSMKKLFVFTYQVKNGQHWMHGRIDRNMRAGEFDLFATMTKWCRESFGKPNKRLSYRWSNQGLLFRFRDQDDAFAFKLRWG